MTLLLYLAKVLLTSGILFGYYWLFLRNKLFHRYNRYYLLAALLLSVILPFIKIPLLYQPENTVNRVVYQTINVLTADYHEEEPLAVNAPTWKSLFTLQNGIYLLYSIGIAFLLVVLFKSFLYIRKIAKKYPYEFIEQMKFYNTSEPGTPFSFFRSIFWNDRLEINSKTGQQVFRHELFHVQQKHSADILLTEIITALFWYNPFFHLIKKEIKAIHEFLADQYAASGNDRYAYAELLVQQTLASKKSPISNYFFQNHIKRRIAMITQRKKPNYGYWSRLMVLPVAAVLFFCIALYAQKPVFANHEKLVLPEEPLTIIIDPGHGGSDNGAVSYDEKFLEKDLALQISRKIQQLASSYNINVVMTRDGDYMPGNTSDVIEGLKYRTSIIEQHHAGMFLSIHVSAAPKVKQGNEYVPNTKGGFELFITNRNNTIMEASRKLGTTILQSLGNIYEVKSSILQQNGKGIYVLDNANCPAVLLECGFITNEKDVAFITNAGNQEMIARKILEGVVNYNNQQAAQNSGGTAHQPAKEKYRDTAVPVIFVRGLPAKDIKDSRDTVPVIIKLDTVDMYIKKYDFDTNLVINLKDSVLVNTNFNIKSNFNTTVDTYKEVNFDTYTRIDTVVTVNRNFNNHFNTELVPDTVPKIIRLGNEARYAAGREAWVDYIKENLKYPEEAISKKIEGKVVVQFIVDENGNTGNIKVISGPAALREEAARILRNSGKWIPMEQQGKPVKAMFRLPIVFKLH